ncbi:MAG: glycosyltransferase family 2 protein [Thermodesulfobacteriota bacterium]
MSRLVIISPCRDEEKYIELVFTSVVNQTRLPDRWIIVNDGSTDATPKILARLTRDYPWIEVVNRQPQGPRQLGPGVVAAFNAGLAHLGDDPYDVIAKLDCDLEFGPDCFAKIMAIFDDPQVGIASATIYIRMDDKIVPVRHAEYHIPGAAKFYRRACFQQIGGLQPLSGWDILDETDARRLGWRTYSDPHLAIISPRPEGAAQGGFWSILKGRIHWGRCAYAIGSHPLFALARGFFRMSERPWILGGIMFLWGFFSGKFQSGLQRTTNLDVVKYLRQEQLYRLFHGNRLPHM